MASSSKVRVSAVQMTSTTDVADNLAAAGDLIERAVSDGAELVVLPENFSFLGAVDADRLAAAEEAGSGPAQDFLSGCARRHGIWIVGGTIPISHSEGRAWSRSLLVGPDGEFAAAYDKIHLFDVDVPDSEAESYFESATTVPGTNCVVGSAGAVRIGMAVCYDLRFPALFHRLSMQGADVLAVPAAFTVPTGRVHWKPLLLARAIESLSYVIASAQWGEHAGGRRTYGHSAIVDPWGAVLAERESGAGIVTAELDMMRLEELRTQFPVLNHRREL